MAAPGGSLPSIKDLATTGVAVAASVAALYAVLSAGADLRAAAVEQRRARGGRDRRRHRARKHEEEDEESEMMADGASEITDVVKSRAAEARAVAVGPDQAGASPGDSQVLAATDSPTPTTAAEGPLLLSALDSDTIDTELARTDAKLRRLLKRKEKLELRRNQVAVAALLDHQSPNPSPASEIDSVVPPSTVLTAKERALFGWAPAIPMPPTAVEVEDEDAMAAAAGGPRVRRVSVYSTGTDTSLTVTSVADSSTVPPATATATSAGASRYLAPPAPVYPTPSSAGSDYNEVDAMAAAAATSSSSSSASSHRGDDDQEDDVDEDSDSDVLSILSSEADGDTRSEAGESSVSSLGSDFSLLSDMRYGGYPH
ncbi:hypothetical protein H9P43_008323 [Blastocladiella emersonii ATCC 22665]|nr:hypothetical protein H9P43_008323 [Blastocladiella emersonii ATCC 22665]